LGSKIKSQNIEEFENTGLKKIVKIFTQKADKILRRIASGIPVAIFVMGKTYYTEVIL